MKLVGEEIKKLEETQVGVDTKYRELLMQVPNLTHPDTPVGGEDAFKVVFEKTATPFAFTPKDHEALMLDLDMIDFERGAKVAGAKFYFAKK
jgi:seryl-tRNA synthetase